MIPPLLAVFLLGTANPAQSLLDELRLATASGSESRLSAKFARKEDTNYLFKMARNRGGLRNIKVALLPAPPGWGTAPYWAVFHTFQEIESEHDPVFEVVPTMDGLIVGREVGERLAGFNRIVHADIKARIFEGENRAAIRTELKLQGTAADKATVLRLNDIFRISKAEIGGAKAEIVVATDTAVPEVKEGQVLQAGSLAIPWTKKPLTALGIEYSGTVNTQGHDKITTKQCYLTAWWVPSTARLPHTTKVTVVGPKSWELRSEGILKASSSEGDRQTVTFQCDLPISYPKIVGGKYALAGQLTDRGRLFRAYQFEPVDSAKGATTVELASKAVAWFEDNLAPFPFPGYDTFDAEGYYGIESYSYTLLEKNITNRFVSHEIGHTYFGGMAPSAYVEDSWNEGVTQYVDSVLYMSNADRTLQMGLASVNLKVPLTAMAVPHDFNSQSYFRGAHVMRMLENEIGTQAMYAGLKTLVTERKGLDTTWKSLLPVFEKASGQDLDWFWQQWVEGASFPFLQIRGWRVERWNESNLARVTVRQSGTPTPFKLRFKIRLSRGPSIEEKVVTMSSQEAVFDIPVTFEPDRAAIDPLGYALVNVLP